LNLSPGSGIKPLRNHAPRRFPMKSRTVYLASAAAALFVAGVSGSALAQDEAASEAKIKCEGVNECKGHGACSSANNSCAGMNSCKGKSFKMMTPDECAAAKAEKPKQ
jgi:uncharacterized membrane protein